MFLCSVDRKSSQELCEKPELFLFFSFVYKIIARLINSVSLSGGCGSSQDFCYAFTVSVRCLWSLTQSHVSIRLIVHMQSFCFFSSRLLCSHSQWSEDCFLWTAFWAVTSSVTQTHQKKKGDINVSLQENWRNNFVRHMDKNKYTYRQCFMWLPAENRANLRRSSASECSTAGPFFLPNDANC